MKGVRGMYRNEKQIHLSSRGALATKDLGNIHVDALEILPPFARLDDKTGCADKLTNKHKKKADTVSQPVRLSCKSLQFLNPALAGFLNL